MSERVYHASNLLWRAWEAAASTMGTTTFHVIVTVFLAVSPFLVTIVTRRFRENEWRAAVRGAFKPGSIVFTLVVWALVFGWFVSEEIYKDHVTLVTARDDALRRLKPVQDTKEQEQAREHLYEFFNVVAFEAYRDTGGFANDIHTRLGQGRGFDPKQSVGGLLREYAENDFASKYTALSNLAPFKNEQVSFKDLTRAFEQLVCSYEKLVFWTQHAAMLVPITPSTDKRFQEWNKTDFEFHRRLKETVSKRGLEFLRQQVNGCRKAFRLRDVVAEGK